MRDDWEIKCLGEIGDIFSGNSINAKTKEEKYLNVTTGLNYIATKDIAYNTSINYDNGVKIPYDQTCNFRVAKKGSVLICSEGGSAGRKIGLLNQDVCFVNKLYAISTNEYVIPSYIFYYYQSIGFKLQFKERLTGLIGGVSKNKFKQIEIPIPSTEEQKEIVEILDQTFESIKKAKANIEKNIENAEELFQSKLNQIFSQTAEGWEHIKLKEVCKTGAGGTPLKSKVNYYLNGNIPWIRSGEVNNRNIIDSKIKITKAGLENSSAKLFPPKTVVIAMYGATAGEVGILNFECSSNQAVCGIYPNNTFVPEFLYYKFLDFKENLKSQAVGGAQPNISQQKIKEVLVPTPTVKIQKEIVETLDIVDNHIQSLISSYDEELKNLEELKKSILQKAFSGELTNKNKAA